MAFFYINEAVIDMRKDPLAESKIVSQALFAERVTIQEEFDQWLKITTPDGYSGWIVSSSVVTRLEPYETTVKTSRLIAHVYGLKDTEYGPIKSLGYGSRLKVLDQKDKRWLKIALPDGRESYIQRGDVMTQKISLTKADLANLSQKFNGLPYTWGGRSSFGYDCSGFVQMLYSQIGIDLQRDAREQVLDRRFNRTDIDKLEPGDLIFFGASAERITHVGMSIGDNLFIHATSAENQPWIRVSQLSDIYWSGGTGTPHPYRTARKWIGYKR